MLLSKIKARWFAAALGALLTLAAAGPARAQDARATLHPSEITLDDAAELRVPSQNGEETEPPGVPGLVFRAAGQSSEMTSINGKVSQSSWTLYQVSARQPGTYSIPIGSQNLTLRVDPAGAQTSPQSGAQPQPGQGQQDSSGGDAGPLAFMRTQIPRGNFYVGQAIPVTFKAYFRPGTSVTLSAPPTLNNSSFTVSDLPDKPSQAVQTIDGRQYEVVTWTALISGTMPGSFSTEASLPIMARYREPRRVASPAPGDPFADDADVSSMFRSMMGSGFGRAFAGFDDPFAPIKERELTLHSPAGELKLLPLPVAGRPAGFSGAVGEFTVHAALTPSDGVAYEPMSLKVQVSGRGNFDRVSLSGLNPSPDFKTYPETESFAPQTPKSTFTGTRTFVQPVVPQRAGALVLPAVAFSYFDPRTATYVTKTSAPLRTTVAMGAASAATSLSAAPAAPASASPDGWRLDHPATTESATLQIPAQQPWFRAAFLLPLLSLAGALWFAWRRRRGPSVRAQTSELRATQTAQRLQMRQAAEQRNVPQFFNAARTVLQAELGQLWSVSPEDVTAEEVSRRLGESGRPLADVLHTAEHILYGDLRVDVASLPECDAILEKALNQLEVSQ